MSAAIKRKTYAAADSRTGSVLLVQRGSLSDDSSDRLAKIEVLHVVGGLGFDLVY